VKLSGFLLFTIDKIIPNCIKYYHEPINAIGLWIPEFLFAYTLYGRILSLSLSLSLIIEEKQKKFAHTFPMCLFSGERSAQIENIPRKAALMGEYKGEA
jgi:hypothetical protein